MRRLPRDLPIHIEEVKPTAAGEGRAAKAQPRNILPPRRDKAEMRFVRFLTAKAQVDAAVVVAVGVLAASPSARA